MTINLFGITKTSNNSSKLKVVFIEKDIKNAKLWFQGYIAGEREIINYTLYKLAEIDEDMKIQNFKIFICTGGQVYPTSNDYKVEQIKLWQKKKEIEKERELIKKLNEEKDKLNNEEIILKLFDGKKMEEK